MKTSDPIFLDRTGRRRRLVTAAGVTLTVLFVAGLALVTAGILGAAPVPLPGLPAEGQRAQIGQQPEGRGGGRLTPGPEDTPAPTGRARTAPAPTSATVTPPSPSVSPSPQQRGNRPTAHPGNGKPSKTR